MIGEPVRWPDEVIRGDLTAAAGLFAKYGMWQARRQGTAERLERLAAGTGQPRNPI